MERATRSGLDEAVDRGARCLAPSIQINVRAKARSASSGMNGSGPDFSIS